MKSKKLATMIAVIGAAAPAAAQQGRSDRPIPRVAIAGSGIKRIASPPAACPARRSTRVADPRGRALGVDVKYRFF
jgi:hypothetical protein